MGPEGRGRGKGGERRGGEGHKIDITWTKMNQFKHSLWLTAVLGGL